MNGAGTSLLKQPAAWVPMALSVAALGVVLGYVAVFGAVHHEDEVAAARVWQLLMVGQLPVIAVFVFSSMRTRPRQTGLILLLQAGLALMAAAPVFILGL